MNEGDVGRILTEIKRQGRAAVAAQASAEACLAKIEQLSARPASNSDDLLGHLLPVFDALFRVQAAASEERFGPPWARRPSEAAKSMEVLVLQLRAALGASGVELIDATDVPFDEEIHRTVERVKMPVAEPQVYRVLSPGYRVDGRLLREAQVVVAVPEDIS